MAANHHLNKVQFDAPELQGLLGQDTLNMATEDTDAYRDERTPPMQSPVGQDYPDSGTGEPATGGMTGALSGSGGYW